MNQWMVYADIDKEAPEGHPWVVVVGSNDLAFHSQLGMWMKTQEEAEEMAQEIAETLRYEP